jgi:hypothetical protein
VGRREFRDRLQKVADFENVTPTIGVASVKKTWQFSQQLVVPIEHATMAAELAEFFAAEVIRIEEEQDDV